MGIHGIYKEIGPGERIALSKLAVQKFEETGRPLRIAIDTSIWLFQIQSSKGGTNPALRTFYYRLLRLLTHSIHPIFVFDGPNKPPFKRNRRTGPNVASIPEFLAKQLLKQFGFPFHIAPGEAEAECALLQREGIVDAVLSEDVDTLMFGSRVTLRNWTPEQKSSKVPTHVNVYDAEMTKSGPAGLDREGMILVALMSGGDYLPEGIPNCGPKLACEAARAGYGSRLCAIGKKDTAALQEWRESLIHELRTNESKFFRCKHKALVIPDEFPRADILAYYTKPALSSREGLERLKRSLSWDRELNLPELRTFTADAFEWVKVTGAKKFIRNLAPALLVRNLRMRGQAAAHDSVSEDPEVVAAEEAGLVTSIHGKRQHPSTDNTPELRIAYSPVGIVNIDLDAEEPDDEPDDDEDDEEEGLAIAGDEDGDAPKKRGPYLYDPTKLEKIWIPEVFVKVGAPLKVQDWEEAQRKKAAQKPAKVTKPRASKPAATGGMQRGALERFTRVTKAGTGRPPAKRRYPNIETLDLSNSLEKSDENPSDLPVTPSARLRKPSRAPSAPPRTAQEPVYIEILSSSPVVSRKETESQPKHAGEHYQSPNAPKRLRTLSPIKPSLSRKPTIGPDTSRTGSIVGEASTSTAPQRTRGAGPSREGAFKAQRAAKTGEAGTSQTEGPEPPPKRRQQRKVVHDSTPSKRQTTLKGFFGLPQGASPSRNRQNSFLVATERVVEAANSSFDGVEALDLSHLSPPARATSKTSFDQVEVLDLSHTSPPARAIWAQPDCGSTGQASPRLSEFSSEAPTRVRQGKETSTKQRALQDTSGSSTRWRKTLETMQVTKEPSSALRRSPRQHHNSPSIASREDTSASRSPLVRVNGLARHDSGVDGVADKAAAKPGNKKVIKLRDSLAGSWKFVDALSTEAADLTGGDTTENSGSRGGGGRRAWRKSEVDMVDMTND